MVGNRVIIASPKLNSFAIIAKLDSVMVSEHELKIYNKNKGSGWIKHVGKPGSFKVKNYPDRDIPYFLFPGDKVYIPPVPLMLETTPTLIPSEQADNWGYEEGFFGGLSNSPMGNTLPCVNCGCLSTITFGRGHGVILTVPVPHKLAELHLVASSRRKGMENIGTDDIYTDTLKITTDMNSCNLGNNEVPQIIIKDIDADINYLLSEDEFTFDTKKLPHSIGIDAFLDNHLLYEPEKVMVKRYVLEPKVCGGTLDDLSTNIYIYPKMGWSGAIVFGYDVGSVKFESNDKWPKTYYDPEYSRIRELTVDTNIKVNIGNRKEELSFGYNKTSYSSTLIEKLTKIGKAKKYIVKKLGGDLHKSASLDIIGPNITIGGSHSLVETNGYSELTSEGEINFSLSVGLKGTFDLADAVIQALKKRSHPLLMAGAYAVDAIKKGGLYNEKANAGLKGGIQVNISISLLVGSTTNNPLVKFTKVANKPWSCKSFSFQFLFAIAVEVVIDRTIGYCFGSYSCRKSGECKATVAFIIEVKKKVEGGEACFFRINGNGLVYTGITESGHTTKRVYDDSSSYAKGQAEAKSLKNITDHDFSIKKKESRKYVICEDWDYPDTIGWKLFDL